jgi:hypothetical protein
MKAYPVFQTSENVSGEPPVAGKLVNSSQIHERGAIAGVPCFGHEAIGDMSLTNNR